EGSTLKRLYNKDILDARIALPALDEQQCVGSFFAKLDSLIALHQREQVEPFVWPESPFD
ncbi:restriction endonuclease subunit S, partial [Adlercreutzia equolifaciens]|uniref:restriction endonuclease subunit S n=1 Tax=Adlercreutzia equolifaciens TaxID=446660 RepID=UPI003AF08B8E